MLVYISNQFCGIGLVVEYVLAKDETGVRFPYPAHKIQDPGTTVLGFLYFNAGRESKDGGGTQESEFTKIACRRVRVGTQGVKRLCDRDRFPYPYNKTQNIVKKFL